MMRFIAALVFALSAQAQTVVYLEPVGQIDTNRAEVGDKPRTFRVVDGTPYKTWLNNGRAKRAFELYATAQRILAAEGNPQKQPAEYYIALVPGGNHAAVGFRVEGTGGVEDHARHAYILLDPKPESFAGTLLHETGHVVMAMMAGGVQLPRADVTAIPHSTATLCDRASAFSEGYAVHLETLAAHMAEEAAMRGAFFHESVRFGGGNYREDEYFRHASDLTSYSQNLARYTDVRDNHFAFESAYGGADYLRVQLEKARNFAELRSANQLLQSEGFQASFFYLFLMRGEVKPSEEEISRRQEKMLRAMRAVFAGSKMEEDTPWLPLLVAQYMKLYPEERDAVIDALNDLSHGVFVDSKAGELWRRHYLAALRLDLKDLQVSEIRGFRKQWHEAVAADPAVLLRLLGPQLSCEVKSVQVKLEAFGEASPLVFDVNTIQAALLPLVPGLTGDQRARWLASRPFSSLEQFGKVVGANLCQ
jgi:hypothetical protein